jgi:copper(I)-binding protein
MKQLFITILASTFGLAACQQDPGPAIAITDVRIIAPMPGSNAGVAYFTITNNGTVPIVITGVRSPQFDRIEMHETSLDDQGVSRMKQLPQLSIPAGTSAAFTTGGQHLMLMGARPDTAAGSPVTLEFEYGDGLLLVSATLQSRLPTE